MKILPFITSFLSISLYGLEPPSITFNGIQGNDVFDTIDQLWEDFRNQNENDAQVTAQDEIIVNDDGSITINHNSEDFVSQGDPEESSEVFTDTDEVYKVDLQSVNSGIVDQDNDVPTLLSIRSKLHTLQQEMVKQVEDLRGKSQINEEESSENFRVALSDIYEAIRNQNENNQSSFDQQKLENDQALEEFESEFESLETRVTDTLTNTSSSLSIQNSGSKPQDFTRFELDVGSHSFYMDPFNDIFTGGINLGITWSDFSSWIKLIIGFIAVWYYWKYAHQLTTTVFQTFVTANMSSPVTSLTIFGNSVGTLVLKAFKIGIMSSLILGVVGNSVLVLLESDILFNGSASSLDSVMGSVGSIIDGSMQNSFDTTWISFSVSLLFDLIPVLSITSMFTTYYTQKSLIWIAMMVGYASAKIAT